MTNACDITDATCEIIRPPSFLPPEMFGERSVNGRGCESAVCQPLLLCSAASANAHKVELIPGLDAINVRDIILSCDVHACDIPLLL